MSRTTFIDDKMSTFFYDIWLTVETVKNEISWDLWRNLILLTMSLINSGFICPTSFDSFFVSQMSKFLVNMARELGSQVPNFFHAYPATIKIQRD